MRTKNIALITIIIIIVCAIGISVYMAQPHYKTITMTDITLEVPESNTAVINNSANYNTYDDKENNLTIKTWSNKDINDTNSSIQAGTDIGTQLGTNIGQNTTYNNITVYNKSGTYTYFEEDIQKQCIIIITGTDIDQVTHAAKTINKTNLQTNTNTNLTIQDIMNQTNNTNNTTIENNKDNTSKKTTATTKKQTTKSSSSSSSSDSDVHKTRFHVSENEKGQYEGMPAGDYVETWTSDGPISLDRVN